MKFSGKVQKTVKSPVGRYEFISRKIEYEDRLKEEDRQEKNKGKMYGRRLRRVRYEL